ncbi:hypothetical protein TWF173_000534 [Orbilia oligospora]|nr:hypothetical protein TWF173_000534 [Orbilia oligospora]
MAMPTNSQVETAPPIPLSFRIRGIHGDHSDEELKACLEKILKTDGEDPSTIFVEITSAKDIKDQSKKVCVVTFHDRSRPLRTVYVHPRIFGRLEKAEDELELDLRTGEDRNDHGNVGYDDKSRFDFPVIVDIGFRGLTPLYEPGEPEVVEANVIAVMGLTPNAYGVWRGETSHRMWLRHFFKKSDSLSKTRSFIFGYDGNLWVEALYRRKDFVNGLIDQVVQLLATYPGQPIIFIGHSYGGLLITDMLRRVYFHHKDPTLYKIYERTRGIFFFAVPHRGMIKIIEEINKGPASDSILPQELADFVKIIQDGGIKIYSFRETKLSNTTERAEDDGMPRKSAQQEVLVDSNSALLHIPTVEKSITAQDKNHRNIVKFNHIGDRTYEATKELLEECLKHAREFKQSTEDAAGELDTLITQKEKIHPFEWRQSVKILQNTNRCREAELKELGDMIGKEMDKYLVVRGPRYTGKKYLMMEYLKQVKSWENLFWKVYWIDAKDTENSCKLILGELQAPTPGQSGVQPRNPKGQLPDGYELLLFKKHKRLSKIEEKPRDKKVLLIYYGVSSVESMDQHFFDKLNDSKCENKIFRRCYLTSDPQALYQTPILKIFNFTLEESIRFLRNGKDDSDLCASGKSAIRDLALACGNHPLLLSNAKKIIQNSNGKHNYVTLCEPKYIGSIYGGLDHSKYTEQDAPAQSSSITREVSSSSKSPQKLPDIWAESLCELFQDLPSSPPGGDQEGRGPVKGLAAFLLLAFTKLHKSHICTRMFQSPRRYSTELNLYKGGMKASCCTTHGEKSLVIDVYNMEYREGQFKDALDSLAFLNFLDYILYESLKAENPNDITDTFFAYPPKSTTGLRNQKEPQRPRASCLLHHFKQISESIQELDKPKEPGTEVSPFECGILPPVEVAELFLKVSAVLNSHSLCDEAGMVLETIERWLKITYGRIPEDHKINGEQYSPTKFRELLVKKRMESASKSTKPKIVNFVTKPTPYVYRKWKRK